MTGDLIPVDKNASETSDFISSVCLSRIQEKLAPATEMSYICTDTAANIKKASGQMAAHWGCLAHILQLCIKDAITQNPIVESDFALIRNICRVIHGSAPLRAALLSAPSNTKRLLVILPNKTRWTSKFEMISRSVELSTAIQHVLKHEKNNTKLQVSFPLLGL